ncbi:unnamed protein product [Ambrosiozyma monospora]|uniref:Unnamed protein product n=1 Tax=Ambrosiozyma monospora TaxID=43982 RepID=A0A9W6YN43_AMBMO|nr:unnamed protein product [Ambrosiozyma monospora]
MNPTSLLTVTLALLVQKSFSYDFQSQSDGKGYVAYSARKQSNSKLVDVEGNGTIESNIITRNSSLYFIDLEVGSNHTPVAVAVDTGSTDFWIPNSIAADFTTDTCSQYGCFDGSDSTTLSTENYPYSSEYTDQSTSEGIYVQDNIYFEGLELKNVTFGLSYNSTNLFGIMGLGPYEGSSAFTTSNGSEIVKTFPMVLKENGLIDKVAYSLALSDDSSASILFGGVDHGRYTGDLAIVPIVNPYKKYLPLYSDGAPFMPITLNSLGVYNAEEDVEVQLVEGSFYTILDSGASYSLFPEEILNTISNNLNITFTDNDFPNVQCSQFFDYHLTFNFQGYEITVPFSKFLSTDDEESDSCIVLMQKASAPGIILGISFYSSVYVVFDMESKVIGLAPLNIDPEYQDIEAIIDSIPSGTTVPGYSATESYWPLEITTIGTNVETTTTKISTLEPNSLLFNVNDTYGGKAGANFVSTTSLVTASGSSNNSAAPTVSTYTYDNYGATFDISLGSLLIGLSVLCCVF